MKKMLIWTLMFLLVLSAVSYADINGPYRDGFIEGYIKEKRENQILIEEYDGTVHQLPFGSSTVFMIDGTYVTAGAFKPGMEVYGELQGRSLTLLEGYSTVIPGYIPPGGKVRSGIVKMIDRDQIIVRTLEGREETYFTYPATIVVKKGLNVPLSTLYEGDRVKLYFDEIDTSFISRMHIEGDSILIKDLYRGQIGGSSLLQDKLVLENVEVFRNGKWESLKNTLQIPYSSDLPLYAGGIKVSYKNLKYYKGKTVYTAIKDHFGKDKIEKMIIKNQYESAFTDKIKDINWYTQALELGNNKNIAFHEGSIIVKSGRLVDFYGLNSKSDVYVVADGRGSQMTADVIYLLNEDINHSSIGQNAVYTGRLDVILQDQVTLKQFFMLDKNEWVSYSGSKDLYYDQDTMIYDVENKKIVSPKEFYAMDYAVDEDTDYAKSKNLKDWYGYLYTDGDRIAGVAVQKTMDSLLPQRITNGVIETVVEDSLVGWKLELKNAADWSNLKEQWMSKNTSISINIEKAMIIKDGKMVEPEDLKSGDKLYIVRNDFNGKVVIVK